MRVRRTRQARRTTSRTSGTVSCAPPRVRFPVRAQYTARLVRTVAQLVAVTFDVTQIRVELTGRLRARTMLPGPAIAADH